MKRRFLWYAIGVLGCFPGAGAPAGTPVGRPFVAAEKLFHQDARWLGSDSAYSVPLGPDRTLWLFADTIIAVSAAHVRAESTFVSNTVAIQTGKDPRTASMQFGWKRLANGAPASFFPEPEPHHRYWPGHGIRLAEGPLVVFLLDIVDTPGKGLGFATAGFAVAVIDRPDAPLPSWEPRIIKEAPSPFDAVPATAVVRDGAHVVALAVRQQGGPHAGTFVRYPAAAFARGDLGRREWWAGPARGWVAESDLGPGGPVFVMDEAGPECSLHWDPRAGAYVHVAIYGFVSSIIGVRTAPALTGPWSAPVQVYRPPESDRPGTMVYAAKAHPELAGPDASDLVITYATNAAVFGDQFTPEGCRSIYWPRFVLLRMGN